MKINQLNGPSPIHDTSTWLSQSIQSITHVCWACKKISLKVLQDSFRPLRFPVNKCFPASMTHAQTIPLAVPTGLIGYFLENLQAQSGCKAIAAYLYLYYHFCWWPLLLVLKMDKSL